MTNWKSRKLWFAVYVFSTFTALLAANSISEETYKVLAGSAVALYLTANVIQKATAKTTDA
ncbi:MAG: hypothetical protein JSS14_21840 [Proteobacteria bacterium]|nr:hypothetical protein [Pseudomonadota bacterium]